MFIVAKQAEQAIMGFGKISRYQLLVGRREHRDELVLKAELKDSGADKAKLSLDINNKFQDICRIKIDRIDLLRPEPFPTKKQGLKDERKWE